MNVILWDFDGVILDSMKIRDLGFVEIFRGFDDASVDRLLNYHRRNGGLSRYVKIRYFYEEILGESISQDEVARHADRFSEIMRDLLADPALLIKETIDFIRHNHETYPMHIVSGSDGNELRYLCGELGISEYFKSIQGSPTPKIQLVSKVLDHNRYQAKDCVLIGDSINDYEAANYNDVRFWGYNNEGLRGKGEYYINTFKEVILD